MSWVLRLARRAHALPKEAWAAILAATVTINYVALYYVYIQFYVPFGLRPADVGHTRVRLLQESLIGVLLAPVTFARRHVAGVVAVFVVALVLKSVHWYRRQRSAEAPKLLAELAATTLVTGVVVFLGLVVLAYVDLARQARDLGNNVRRDGHIVISTVTGGRTYLPVLDVQAIPADLITKSGSPAAPLTEGCILYLGRNEDEVVVLDVRKDVIVRARASDVVVVMHPALRHYHDERLPQRCTSDEGNVVEP